MKWTMIGFWALAAVFSVNFFMMGGISFPQGLIEPRYPAISLPKAGLAWLPGEDFRGTCEEVSAKEWIRKHSGTFDLLVHADGPSGSGRFWILTAGIAGIRGEAPDRGFCLQTSTLGWRTLQRFKDLPLPWADDLDGDGKAELIIWDSFPLSEEGSAGEFALMAWVYRVNPDGAFTLDWSMTRTMAGELAEAYRLPVRAELAKLQKVRSRIARVLEKFALQSKGGSH